ncbi:MAG TPA: acylphosphatase [Elusimicrobiales bacterium]|nr:acylphosphatase [Elusimicrobiales bacterium]
MQKLRVHSKIIGRVQGIGYRWFVIDMAKEFNITGWVKNHPDGSVELEAQGDKEDLKKFEQVLKTEHSMASVTEIKSNPLPSEKNEKDFNILY